MAHYEVELLEDEGDKASAAGDEGGSNSVGGSRQDDITMAEAISRAGMGRLQVATVLTDGVAWAGVSWSIMGLVFISDLAKRQGYADLSSPAYLLTFMGWMTGAATLGQVVDWGGRRWCSLAFALLGTLLMAASGASLSPWIFYAFRYAIGIAMNGGLMPAAFVHASEFVIPRYQSIVSMWLNMSWAIMGCALAGVASLVPDLSWRVMCLITAAPTVAYIAIFPLCVWESPKYYLSRGRADKAAHVLRRVAKLNKMPLSPLEGFEKSHALTTTSKVGVLHMISLFERRFFVRTMTLSQILSTLALGYYTLSINPKSSAQSNLYLSAFLVSFAEIPGYFIGGMLAHFVGHRISMSLYLGMAGVALLLTGVPGIPARLLDTLPMIGKMFISAAYTSAFSLTADLYPTSHRATAFSATQMVSRVGSGISPVVTMLGRRLFPGSESVAEYVFPRLLVGTLALGSSVLACIALPRKPWEERVGVRTQSEPEAGEAACHALKAQENGRAEIL